MRICNKKSSFYLGYISRFLVIVFFMMVGDLNCFAQQIYPQNNFVVNQPNYNNYMANSTAFRQEIARLEINVVREGKAPLSITQVPRLEKDDILKVRLLEEQVNGLKPSESNFDWTFLVAFVNPGRNSDSQRTVSEEINFRKRGWYKEYAFSVPYDSQPIFFLYPKPQYRTKILNLINKNQDEIRKIGEKTIEIADAYAKIGSFLNELQYVVNRNYYRGYNNGYGLYGNYQNNGLYGNNGGNDHLFTEQVIERLAKSFNIQLPGCWGGNNQYGSGYGNSGYYNGNNGNYGNYGNYGGYYNGGYGQNDFVGRVQCVARSVRMEDFDVSISRMLQQGGVMAAAQLAQKYPQIAFWINIAAAALDFILKITNKTPLKIVPTVITSNENQLQQTDSSKISLFAEAQPSENGFVTAYPLVFHKWQANADPNMIGLPLPVLTDSCLHAGQNIIRTTDVINDWMSDNFTKDFKLTISSPNGFRKEFPLKKNVGLSGWELNVTKEDLLVIPKINMLLEAVITGKRGFNQIQSPKFDIQLTSSGNWTIEAKSRNSFAVGGKRLVTLVNQSGNCRCLESVVYKPMFGGQFVFDSKNLIFSADSKEVSFEVDATSFPASPGQLELRQNGGDVINLPLNLYQPPPSVTGLKIAKGDNQAVISGERLEQIQAIRINGKRAVIKTDSNVINSQPMINTMKPTSSADTQKATEKTFVFEDSSRWQESNNLSLELELEDQRTLQHPNLFAVSATRPSIVANEAKELDGFIVSKTDKSTATKSTNLPIFPIETSEIVVNIQNTLTDFDFKIENLAVETRVENTQINPIEETDIIFEVLDWRSIRLNLRLSENTKKMLGGRRIQFRLADKVRGNSDWYSIKQTFVRMPQIASFNCPPQLSKECQLTGNGISYIQQISLDNGVSWFPQDGTGLVSKPTINGLETALIPNMQGKSSIVKIKLRDFPKAEGLPISNFISPKR